MRKLSVCGCRGSSIKTRIETPLQGRASTLQRHVAEVVPLKQGLKQDGAVVGRVELNNVAEVVPLKQGLKLMLNLAFLLVFIIVAEVVPLKQGLKRY